MNNAKTNSTSEMEDNIRKLESLASDLKIFFESCKTSPLFKKLPLREDVEERKQRLSDGHYLFRPCGVELNKNESNRIAVELLDLLKKNLSDRTEDLNDISEAMVQEKIKANDLLLQIIKNEGNHIRKVIRDNNLAEDIFTFFAIYFARPYRQFASEYLLEGLDKLNWFSGYCPVCGHWPGMAHINSEVGQRTLWCLCCNTKWNFKRTQCAYCLNEDHKSLQILNPESEESYRVQVCKKCKRYLKEVRGNIELKDFPFDKFYLGTLPLDIIAAQKGYIQESVLTVRYDNSDGNELLMYRQKVEFN
ncbi:MAG: formate dehydrogenase accessory protein FdhE [Ignavibacteriales bacterium]|nr:formate dehydrogenase accessory protein FdhE [Ignavibacteriales bacterium]